MQFFLHKISRAELRNNSLRSLYIYSGLYLYWGFISFCLSFLSLSNVYAAQTTVIQNVKLSTTSKQEIRIDIEFGIPLLYIKHFPQKSGEILQIQLRINEGDDKRIHKEVRQANDIIAPRGLESLLIYVTYEEGVPGGPYLTLRFSESVDFELRAGSSLQSLAVIVKNDQILTETGSKKKAESKTTKKKKSKARTKTDENSDRQIDEMMAKARQTLTFGDSKGAAELLRKIIRMPGNKHQQDARELLGLALERSNEIPRAKFEYKKYLRLYTDGDGPERVRQRLTALQNLGLQKKKKLRRTRRGRKDDRYKVFGRWSQSYNSFYVQSRPDNNKLADPGNFVASRIANSHLSLRGRYRGVRRNVQTLVELNNTYDFLDRDDSESRVSYLNIAYDDFRQDWIAILGRQRIRNAGVFGRFDGLIGGVRLSRTIKPHIFFGKPVNFFDSKLYDKSFWGTRWDLGKAKSPLNGNVYFVHQQIDGIHDRQAIGGVLRYSLRKTTFFGLLDYDLEFDEIITTSIRMGFQATPKTKFNFSFNDRSDLLTSKAVMIVNVKKLDENGNPIDIPTDITIDKYTQNGLSDEDIFTIAKSQANRTQNSTLGMTYQVDKDRQINLDLSVYSSSGTDVFPTDVLVDSGFTPAEKVALASKIPSPGTDNHFLYAFQWISSNTFIERDLHVLGFRFAQTVTYDEFTAYVNSRLPPVRNWNLRPRFSISQREFATSNSQNGNPNTATGSLITIKPSMKFDYRWKKAWLFDIDLSIEYLDYSKIENQDGFRESVRLSYHYTF